MNTELPPSLFFSLSILSLSLSRGERFDSRKKTVSPREERRDFVRLARMKNRRWGERERKGGGDKNYEGFIVHNHVKGYVEASSNYVDRILSCWICRFSTDSINYELVEIFQTGRKRREGTRFLRPEGGREEDRGRASFLSGKVKPEKGLEGDTREERVKAKGGGENGKSANGTKLSSSSSSSSLATLGRLLPFIERKKGKRARGKKDVSNAISQGRRLRGCLLFSTWLCALLVASIP